MSGLFTSIDLSQLPPPKILENPGYQATLEEWKSNFLARFPGFSGLELESDPITKLLEVGAYRETVWRQTVIDQSKALLLAYAPRDVLIHLAAAWGLSPLEGEDTDRFRARIQGAPEALSTAGPDGAYVVIAQSASPLIKDVRVLSPTPGAVVLVLLSSAGDGTAPQELLDAALSAVDNSPSDLIRPLTDSVTAESAQIVPYHLDATVEIYPGVDGNTVLSAARASAESFCARSHALGLGVTESSLKAALTVEGVHRVYLASPADGVACTARQAAYCRGISLASTEFEAPQ